MRRLSAFISNGRTHQSAQPKLVTHTPYAADKSSHSGLRQASKRIGPGKGRTTVRAGTTPLLGNTVRICTAVSSSLSRSVMNSFRRKGPGAAPASEAAGSCSVLFHWDQIPINSFSFDNDAFKTNADVYLGIKWCNNVPKTVIYQLGV